MEQTGVLMNMPKKPKGRGRPRTQQPLRSIVSLKGTDALEAWMDELTKLSESGTRANMLRRSMRAFAAEQGFAKNIPER